MSKSDEVREFLNVALKDMGILAQFKADPAEFREAVECTLAALVALERDRLLKSGPAPIAPRTVFYGKLQHQLS